MKGLRIKNLQAGGYLGPLEQSRPELFKTISNYRQRLQSTPEKLKTFDQRANIQYGATMNMPENQRQAYISSIEKQFAKPTDEQFANISKGLESKTFTPTYSFIPADTSKPAPTTGYYRDLSKEIAEAEKNLKNLTFTSTQQKTRPQYEVSYPRTTTYGQPRAPEMTTTLPQGAVLTRGPYGREYLQEPIKNRTSMGQTNLNPQYRQVGSQTYTETTTRPARAGDPEYDKQAAALDRLKTRHQYRYMYSNRSPKKSAASIYESFARPTGTVNPYAKFTGSRTAKLQKGGGIAIRGTNFKGVR